MQCLAYLDAVETTKQVTGRLARKGQGHRVKRDFAAVEKVGEDTSNGNVDLAFQYWCERIWPVPKCNILELSGVRGDGRKKVSKVLSRLPYVEIPYGVELPQMTWHAITTRVLT